MNIIRGTIVKYNKNLLVLQFFWVTLYLRFFLFDSNTQRFIQLLGCGICSLYCLKHIHQLVSKTMVTVFVYSLLSFVSSYINYGMDNLGLLLNGFLYSLKVFLIFAVFTIVGKYCKIESIAKSLLNISLVVWVPTVISVFRLGRTIENSDGVYLIGNKFSVAYLNILMLCMMGILSMRRKNEIEANQSRHRIKQIKKKFWIFYIISVFLSWYMRVYTGMVMLFIIGGLYIAGKWMEHKGKINFNSIIYQTIKKPSVLVLSMIISGYVISIFQIIISSPFIADLLQEIGKTETIASRAQIFSNLPIIISKSKFWGYGYGSMIVTTYFGVNPQNGLMEIIVYFGYLGVTALLCLSAAHVVSAKYVNSESGTIILYCIYAFIVSSIVEITYSTQFFILLALFHVHSSQKRKSLHYIIE